MVARKSPQAKLSVVIPVHNESANLTQLYEELRRVLRKEADYDPEIIFVNDGSTDGSLAQLQRLAREQPAVQLLSFSRNFGKEIATTAGISAATGDAVIIMDGDGQHPPAVIPRLLAEWRRGSKVVVGVRRRNRREGFGRRLGSWLFYKMLKRLTKTDLVPRSTDFRLIDQTVQAEFKQLEEYNRITRGLIDWLGFERRYVDFDAPARAGGEPAYKLRQLIELALNSFVSLSFMPLYFSGYAGLVITPVALVLGVFMLLEKYAFNDPWHLNFTGTASLSVLTLFLVGLLLISQGLLALYVSHIYTETRRRPLYVIDHDNSVLKHG